ncbi:hypothetical protein OFEAOIEE_LOCUS4395 [Methylorubrum extorquens]
MNPKCTLTQVNTSEGGLTVTRSAPGYPRQFAGDHV